MEKKQKINQTMSFNYDFSKLTKLIIKNKGHLIESKIQPKGRLNEYVQYSRNNFYILNLKKIISNLFLTFQFLNKYLDKENLTNPSEKVLLVCDSYSEPVLEEIKSSLSTYNNILIMSGVLHKGFLNKFKNIKLIISLDSVNKYELLREAKSFNIPVVGLCGTTLKTKADAISYPIYTNLNNKKCVFLYVLIFNQFFKQKQNAISK